MQTGFIAAKQFEGGMSMNDICIRCPKKRFSAAERKARQREQALEACQHGRHTLTATFRPGEQMCTVCGLISYCPDCLRECNLPIVVGRRVFPCECPRHRQKAEVKT